MPCSASLAASCSLIVGQTLKQASPSRPLRHSRAFEVQSYCAIGRDLCKSYFSVLHLLLNLTETFWKMWKKASCFTAPALLAAPVLLPHYWLLLCWSLILHHAAVVCPDEVDSIQAPGQAGEPNAATVIRGISHVKKCILKPTAPPLESLLDFIRHPTLLSSGSNLLASSCAPQVR